MLCNSGFFKGLSDKILETVVIEVQIVVGYPKKGYIFFLDHESTQKHIKAYKESCDHYTDHLVRKYVRY